MNFTEAFIPLDGYLQYGMDGIPIRKYVFPLIYIIMQKLCSELVTIDQTVTWCCSPPSFVVTSALELTVTPMSLNGLILYLGAVS